MRGDDVDPFLPMDVEELEHRDWGAEPAGRATVASRNPAATATAVARVLSPMVEYGIVREENLADAANALRRAAEGQGMTPSEADQLRKMAPHLKARAAQGKRSALPWLAAGAAALWATGVIG